MEAAVPSNKNSIRLSVAVAIFVLLSISTLFRPGSTDIFPFVAVNLSYCLLIFVTTIYNVGIGCFLLFLTLPFNSGFHLQINAFFGTGLHPLNLLALDGVNGFLSGFLLRNYFHTIFKKRPKNRLIQLSLGLIGAFLGFCATMAFVAIARNLFTSGSVYSTKGILFNLWQIRSLGWHFDYFPFMDLFAYTGAILMGMLFLTYGFEKPFFDRYVISPIILAAVFISGYGMAQFFWHIGWVKSGFGRGVNSVLPDLHSFAGFLFILFAIGYVDLTEKQNGWPKKLQGFFYSALATTVIVMSGSRFITGILGLVVIWYLVGLVWRWFKRTRMGRGLKIGLTTVTLSLIGCGILAMVVFFWDHQARLQMNSFASLLDWSQFDLLFSYRPQVFREALAVFAHYPLFGLGQGSFFHAAKLPDFMMSTYLVDGGGENAHNYFLQVLAELGIVGFALFVGMIILALKSSSENRRSKAIIWALVGANLFDHHLLVREMMVIFMAAVAMTLATGAMPTEGKVLRFFATLRPVWKFGLISLVLLCGIAEVVRSFGRVPLVYGALCNKEFVQYDHGLINGYYEKTIDPSKPFMVSFVPVHADIMRRPLNVAIDIIVNGKIVDSKTAQMHNNNQVQIAFPSFPTPKDAVASLKLRLDRCFIPRNQGVSEDVRHLGLRDVKIKEMPF